MASKRRRERVNKFAANAKVLRGHKRSSSESGLIHDPVNAEKRQVLKRLFGRNCNSAFDGEVSSTSSDSTFNRRTVGDVENIDEDDKEEVEREESPVREVPQRDEEQDANNDEYPNHRYFNIDDENSDPLLDSVPVDLDPEQLGFLVCAQETLRFLNRRGFAFEHPVFTRLRSRLLRGMDELAVA